MGSKNISKLFQKLKNKADFSLLKKAVEFGRVNLRSLFNLPFFYFRAKRGIKVLLSGARHGSYFRNLYMILPCRNQGSAERSKAGSYFAIISVILLGLILFSSGHSPKAALIQTSYLKSSDGAFLSSLFKELAGSKEQDLFLGQKEILLPESPDLSLIQENSLAEVSCPQILSLKALGAIVGEGFADTRKEIVEYIVQPGDTLSLVAKRFNLSELNTLLWANNLESSKILVGQKLIILPVDGVIHHVKTDETVNEIAKIYKGKIEEVIAFNELSPEGNIYIGDILIVPGGKMPSKPSIIVQVPIGNSYFIIPTEGKISQGLHWYNAIDIANKCGTPIYAAASGTVLKVKMTSSRARWAYSGFGNHLTILHPNGVVTYYGHILYLSNSVSPGDEVYQGQKIASMGGQPGTPGAGRSTGCHLHFGVSHAKNPLRNYPVLSFIAY